MKENRPDHWKLFFSTGLPEAYTYLKAEERQAKPREEHPGARERRG